MNDRSQGDQNKHAKQLTKEFDSFQRQKILLNIKVSERKGVVGQRHCGGECAAAFDVTVSFPSPVPMQLNQLCFLYVFLVVVTVSCESHLVAVIAAFIFCACACSHAASCVLSCRSFNAGVAVQHA